MKRSRWIAVGLAVATGILVLYGCFPSLEDLEAVDFTPLAGDDWEVSTPEVEGLDPMLVAQLYLRAAELETLYGLLVIKNGYPIAEDYFNEGAIDQLSGRQSVTKSVTSVLVGIALDQEYLSGVDQQMMEFFPELADQITDPRKTDITIRDLLQMRGGYPDEERMRQYLGILFFTDNWFWVPHLADFPLVSDPGAEFNYSNLTSHLLGVIVARACDTDLKSFAQEHLFSPLDAEVGEWTADADGYNMGCIEIHVTARDTAKFGLLYLNDGKYGGNRSCRLTGSGTRTEGTPRASTSRGGYPAGMVRSAISGMGTSGGRPGWATTISTTPRAMAGTTSSCWMSST